MHQNCLKNLSLTSEIYVTFWLCGLLTGVYSNHESLINKKKNGNFMYIFKGAYTGWVCWVASEAV